MTNKVTSPEVDKSLDIAHAKLEGIINNLTAVTYGEAPDPYVALKVARGQAIDIFYALTQAERQLRKETAIDAEH